MCGLAFNFSHGQALASCKYPSCFCGQLVADSHLRKALLAMDTYPTNRCRHAALGMALPKPGPPLVKRRPCVTSCS